MPDSHSINSVVIFLTWHEKASFLPFQWPWLWHAASLLVTAFTDSDIDGAPKMILAQPKVKTVQENAISVTLFFTSMSIMKVSEHSC